MAYSRCSTNIGLHPPPMTWFVMLRKLMFFLNILEKSAQALGASRQLLMQGILAFCPQIFFCYYESSPYLISTMTSTTITFLQTEAFLFELELFSTLILLVNFIYFFSCSFTPFTCFTFYCEVSNIKKSIAFLIHTI